MLEKYRSNFESLTPEESAYVASSLGIDEGNLFAELESRGHDQCSVVLGMASDPSPMAVVCLEKIVGKPIVRERAEKKHVSRGGPVKRVSKIVDNRVIVKVGPNPKKQGSASWERFNLYKEGMTVGQFIKAGGTSADVKWDAERSFIELDS